MFGSFDFLSQSIAYWLLEAMTSLCLNLLVYISFELFGPKVGAATELKSPMPLRFLFLLV